MDIDVAEVDTVRSAAISAAEARRQKILSRSKDRLSKITYGISSLTTEETPVASGESGLHSRPVNRL